MKRIIVTSLCLLLVACNISTATPTLTPAPTDTPSISTPPTIDFPTPVLTNTPTPEKNRVGMLVVNAVNGLPQRPDHRSLPNWQANEVEGLTFAAWGGKTIWQEAQFGYTDGPTVFVICQWPDDATKPAVASLAICAFEVTGEDGEGVIQFEPGPTLFQIDYLGGSPETIWVHIGPLGEDITMSALEEDLNH